MPTQLTNSRMGKVPSCGEPVTAESISPRRVKREAPLPAKAPPAATKDAKPAAAKP